jgi:hypothetical protein
VLSGVGGVVNRRLKGYDLIPIGGSVTTFALRYLNEVNNRALPLAIQPTGIIGRLFRLRKLLAFLARRGASAAAQSRLSGFVARSAAGPARQFKPRRPSSRLA